MASKTSGRATFVTALVARIVCGVSPASAHNFVGAKACGSCHSFAYEVWAQGPHARAHQSLTPGQLADVRCASCHSSTTVAINADAVAATLPPAAGRGDIDGRSLAQAAPLDLNLLGVQCEHCHGPGKSYQPDYVMRDKTLSRALGLIEATPAGCLTCHTEGSPSLESFDYRTMWARIDHGRAAEARWAATQAPGPGGDVGPGDEAAPPASTETTPAAVLLPAASSLSPIRAPSAGASRHKSRGRHASRRSNKAGKNK